MGDGLGGCECGVREGRHVVAEPDPYAHARVHELARCQLRRMADQGGSTLIEQGNNNKFTNDGADSGYAATDTPRDAM